MGYRQCQGGIRCRQSIRVVGAQTECQGGMGYRQRVEEGERWAHRRLSESRAGVRAKETWERCLRSGLCKESQS